MPLTTDEEILKDWSDHIRDLEMQLSEARIQRDAGIRIVVNDSGWKVSKVTALTGLTKMRVSQILHEPRQLGILDG